MRVPLAALILLTATAAPVLAHELRPGYLELRETPGETYAVFWKVPAKGDKRLSLRPRLPEGCTELSPPVTTGFNAAFADRWAVRCPGGLDGRTISIDGLASTLTDVLVRIEWASGEAQVVRLTPEAPSFVVAAAPDAIGIAKTYMALGVEHILLGVDHLLFVLALLLLIEGRRRLVSTITAFTVAHSLTLAAATLGLVHVPQGPVEAVIALSILFLASEIVRSRRGGPSLTKRRPWIAASAFGLLHGLGFAGALSSVGVPAGAIPVALLFFNVGVEIGQLAFVAVVLALLALGRRSAWASSPWAWRLPAYGIGVAASYWLIERVSGFWS